MRRGSFVAGLVQNNTETEIRIDLLEFAMGRAPLKIKISKDG